MKLKVVAELTGTFRAKGGSPENQERSNNWFHQILEPESVVANDTFTVDVNDQSSFLYLRLAWLLLMIPPSFMFPYVSLRFLYDKLIDTSFWNNIPTHHDCSSKEKHTWRLADMR